MEKLPSVLGELRDSQVLSRRSPYQANASQLINLSHQWLGLLDRIKDSSFASATRLLQSLLTISAGCLMFTSKSQQKGCKRWLPRDSLKPMLELKIKHKHGGFNINYEKATVVWQQFGFGS
jgi:hypothetical protein